MTEPTATPNPDAAPVPVAAGIASPMIAAIERAWAAIAANHPELPSVVVTMATGAGGKGQRIVAGRFERDVWAHREHASANALEVGAQAAELHGEIFIGAEGLARPAHEVFASLLGQAAHALAYARGESSSSRQGRFLNRTFARLADELGVITRHVSRAVGYEIIGLTDETMLTYAGEIFELGMAITHTRTMPADVVVPAPDREPAPVSGGVAVAAPVVRRRPGAVCGCGREVHIARKDLAAAPIICGLCLVPFAYAD